MFNFKDLCKYTAYEWMLCTHSSTQKWREDSEQSSRQSACIMYGFQDAASIDCILAQNVGRSAALGRKKTDFRTC